MKHYLLFSLIILLGGPPVFVGLRIGEDKIKVLPLITDETMRTKWENNPYYLRIKVVLPRGIIYKSIFWADEEDRVYTYRNIRKSDSSSIFVNNCEIGVYGKSYYDNEMHARHPDIFKTFEEYASIVDTTWTKEDKYYRKIRVGDIAYGYECVAFDKVDILNKCLNTYQIDTIYFNPKRMHSKYF